MNHTLRQRAVLRRIAERRLDDSPYFWTCAGLIAGALYVARVYGWLL